MSYLQLYHVSLGLMYLHSHKIVHGDLKAVRICLLVGHIMTAVDMIIILQCNVLIDASGSAVLCNFGLSSIKADITSQTVVKSDGESIIGSRNWMAPEPLLGQSLKKPCDIYSFGMTLYKVSIALVSFYTSHVEADPTTWKIFVNEIPLGHVDPVSLIDLVAY
jgi:serine/threonine protein kinase